MPATTPVHMTFSGPKGVELAGEVADELTIAVGLDVPSLRAFTRRARAARAAAGVTTPLKIWLPVQIQFADSRDDIPMLRHAAAGMTSLSARFTFFNNFEDKHIPAEWQGFISEALTRYDFGHHAQFSDNPNARLFDARPEIRDYMIDRFALVGSPEHCAERLASVVRDAELDGIWAFPVSLTREPADVRRKLEIAARLLGALRG
jgi:alkanesulfonate monooxygenase SsuD/methylene tetrahydromethanopterin reductase-like flavin-dependent oxidoreductase (luciferase family)